MIDPNTALYPRIFDKSTASMHTQNMSIAMNGPNLAVGDVQISETRPNARGFQITPHEFAVRHGLDALWHLRDSGAYVTQARANATSLVLHQCATATRIPLTSAAAIVNVDPALLDAALTGKYYLSSRILAHLAIPLAFDPFLAQTGNGDACGYRHPATASTPTTLQSTITTWLAGFGTFLHGLEANASGVVPAGASHSSRFDHDIFDMHVQSYGHTSTQLLDHVTIIMRARAAAERLLATGLITRDTHDLVAFARQLANAYN